MKLLAGLSLVLLLSGCGATHQVKFDPWRGMAAEAAQDLARGEMAFSKEAVFKAASDVLEHEPFFEWEFIQMDAAQGLIEASAGDLRHLRMELTDAGGNSLSVKSKISVKLPGKKLEGKKSVWMSREDSLIVTAYDIPFSRREPWEDVSAEFELEQDYLVSAIYRQLTDKSAVPFALEALDSKKQGEP